MSIAKKDLKKYLSSIEANLICSKDEKKKILSDYESSINDFISEDCNNSMEAVYAHFGSPQDIAKAYLTYADPVYVKKAVDAKKVAAVSFIILILSVIIYLMVSFIQGLKYETIYIVESAAVEVVDNSINYQVQGG